MLSIGIINLQAVFLEQRNDVVFKINEALSQDVFHDRLPDLELTQSVEVNFIDGPTGSDKSYVH
jgi:hypothetical protein